MFALPVAFPLTSESMELNNGPNELMSNLSNAASKFNSVVLS